MEGHGAVLPVSSIRYHKGGSQINARGIYGSMFCNLYQLRSTSQDIPPHDERFIIRGELVLGERSAKLEKQGCLQFMLGPLQGFLGSMALGRIHLSRASW